MLDLKTVSETYNNLFNEMKILREEINKYHESEILKTKRMEEIMNEEEEKTI